MAAKPRRPKNDCGCSETKPTQATKAAKPKSTRKPARAVRNALVLMAFMLMPSMAFSQIEAPAVIPEFTVGTATCMTQKPNGGKIRYRWSADAGVSVVPSSTGKLCYYTAPKGTYTLQLIVATSSPDDLTLTPYVWQFTVGDAPEPPTPPNPPDPVDISSLFSTETRATLSEFYRDLSSAVSATPPVTAEDFLQIHAATVPTVGVSETGRTALIARVSACSQSMATLPTCLTKLADELAPDSPTPPPTPVAEKLWIIALGDPQAANWTPQQAKFVTDTVFWRGLSGVEYEYYPKGTAEYSQHKSDSPHENDLLFLDQSTGKLLRVVEIPSQPTREWAQGIINELTGK